MFSDTIFDNTQVVNQKSTFQYINILAPLNFHTEVTVRVYEKLVELVG